MIWLNLNVAILDSPEVVGAEPVERATWLFLLRFCVGQENGGRIAGCRNWKDRQWQQLARVTQAETQAETKLWVWDGDDLIVSFYPSEKEEEIAAKRSGGANGGKVRSERKAQASRENGAKNKAEPKLNPSLTQAGTQGKRRERKRKEEKGMEVGACSAVASPTSFELVSGVAEKPKQKKPKQTPGQFIESLKLNPAFRHINMEIELGKMDAWLSTRPGKQKTPRFVVAWLNRIPAPLPTQQKPQTDTSKLKGGVL